MIEHLNSTYNSDSIVFVQSSIPNGNYFELYFLKELFKVNQIPLELLCVSICYDDLREYPIKNDFLDFIENNIKISFEGDVKKLLHEKNKKAIAKEKTPNILMEEAIVAKMEDNFPSYARRDKIIAKNKILATNIISESIIMISGMKMRSGLAGEKKTPSINSTDSIWNMLAINELINEAVINKEKALFYMQPLRPHSDEFPYDSLKYDNFKTNLQASCAKSSFTYYDNLENIVPQEYWGKTDIGYPDIFHFQEKGHQLLAKKLSLTIQNIVD